MAPPIPNIRHEQIQASLICSFPLYIFCYACGFAPGNHVWNRFACSKLINIRVVVIQASLICSFLIVITKNVLDSLLQLSRTNSSFLSAVPPCFTFLQGCFIFLVTACSDNVCFCCCAAFSLSPVKLLIYQSCGLCSLFTDRALIEIPSYPRLLTRVSRRLILGCRQKISSVFSFPCALGSPFS